MCVYCMVCAQCAHSVCTQCVCSMLQCVPVSTACAYVQWGASFAPRLPSSAAYLHRCRSQSAIVFASSFVVSHLIACLSSGAQKGCSCFLFWLTGLLLAPFPASFSALCLAMPAS